MDVGIGGAEGGGPGVGTVMVAGVSLSLQERSENRVPAVAALSPRATARRINSRRDISIARKIPFEFYPSNLIVSYHL